jgi:hypothetical protein
MKDTTIARLTGAAYLGNAVTATLSFLAIRSQLVVAGDPGATLTRVTENQGLAHLGLVLELLSVVTQALAGVGFFALFRRDRPVAAFGVAAFGLANALIILVSTAFDATALAVVANHALAPAGDAAATVGLLYALSAGCWTVASVFFGLWLIPMGWFAVSTRRMPKVLGWILMVGGVGYVVSALLLVGVPPVGVVVNNILPMVATVGELWMVGYLLLFGIRPAVPSSTTVAA